MSQVYTFTDSNGEVRLMAEISPAPGATPASVVSKELRFTETVGAGTYTGTIALPAGARVYELEIVALAAPWLATVALLNASDTLNGAGAYYSDLDLTVGGDLQAAYDPTDPTGSPAVKGYQSLLSKGFLYNRAAPFISETDAAVENPPGILYALADAITVTITTTGAAVAGGITLVRCLYVVPTVTNASKA